MKKLIIIFFLIAAPFLVFAQSANQPASAANLQKQIQDLLRQVQALQQQVAALQAELGKEPEKAVTTGETPQAGSTEAPAYKSEVTLPELTRSLSRGASGDDVRKLQEFLAKDKEIYPEGLLTGYFGPLTESAVKKWQKKNGIESLGIVGPKTIAKFQELGRGVVQGLIKQGSGTSDVIPPGLLQVPGIEKKLEISTTTAPSSTATTTSIRTTSAAIAATTTATTAVTTPAGTIPAVPATPAVPAQPSSGGPQAVPAIPATPATPATTTAAIPSSDAIAPSVPTGLTATPSYYSIALSWSKSTDNVGVAGYKIYKNGAQIFSAATSTSLATLSAVDFGLNPATSYSYTVAAYDAAGNVSNQSAFASATTLSAGPPAPTNVQAVTTSSSQDHPPKMWYYLTFNYTLQQTTQSFAVYRKRPSDASFVKYTYSAQTPVNPSILPIPGSNESNLYHRDPNQWQWWTTLPAPAPDTAQGEYKFYVAAVDTSGVESAPSETKSFKLYAAPVIVSPADSSTVSSPFTITVSGDPNASNPTYGMALYKKITGDTAWSAWPAPSTSFAYTGPALNPSDNPHRLVVWFSSAIYDRSFFGASIFNISTTTSSLDLRAKNLAAISQALNLIKGQLLELLQKF